MPQLSSQTQHLLLALGIGLLSGCSRSLTSPKSPFAIQVTHPAAQTASGAPSAAVPVAQKQRFKTRFITGANHSCGYQVLADGRVLIHQPTIPGHPGTDGFKTRKEARRVAALVVHKLQHHQMPPSVSSAELDSLKVRR